MSHLYTVHDLISFNALHNYNNIDAYLGNTPVHISTSMVLSRRDNSIDPTPKY